MKLKYLGLALLLLLISVYGVIRYQLSPAYVIHKIDRVSGVEKVNSEISLLLDEIYRDGGGNKVKFLYEEDLRNFPSIAALGNAVSFFPVSSEGLPAHITIRYGSHFVARIVYIMDPRITHDLPVEDLDKIADNIYMTHLNFDNILPTTER